MRCTWMLAALLPLAGCGGGSPAQSQPDPADSLYTISMVFGGDVMQHMPQVRAAALDSGGYDYRECFQYLRPIFDSADLAVVNFETTVSANGRYSGYPMFSSPPELMAALAGAGVDAVMLANNHIADRGRAGVEATVAAVEKHGLAYSGAWRDSADHATMNPLTLSVKGTEFHILNYTYSLNGLPMPRGCVINMIDTATIAADLAKIDRCERDRTIIFFHWGDEYSRTPSATQTELAAWCREQGVRILIGSHPHVVQPVVTENGAKDDTARWTGSVTAWSLGNLVSNQRKRYTDGGILLRLDMVCQRAEIVSVAAAYIPAWVHTPQSGGRQRYLILPPSVADTMLVSDTPARTQYDRFIADTRTLLARDSLLKEGL